MTLASSVALLLLPSSIICLAGAECEGQCAGNLSNPGDPSVMLQLHRRSAASMSSDWKWKWPGVLRYCLPRCSVGDHVACPGSGTMCAGDECCPGFNGSGTFPCPSAPAGFARCESNEKVEDCVDKIDVCRLGDIVQCPSSGAWRKSGQCCPRIGSGPTFPSPSAPENFVRCESRLKVSNCLGFSSGTDCTDPNNLKQYQHGWRVYGVGSGGRRRRGDAYFMPVYSTQPLDKAQSNIERVAIFIHGKSADADHYFCDAEQLAATLALQDTTLTVAPWFGSEDTVLNATGGTAAGWDPDHLDSALEPLWWSGSGWLDGGDSSSSTGSISSFSVLDSLISHLVNIGYNKDRISIAGFSAGCQFVSRWAFWSTKGTIPRSIVSDCGSYMYLNDARPDPSCITLENTGTEHSCSNFEVPSPPPEGYNDYKYGLTLEGKYATDYSYLQPFVSNSVGVNEQFEAFKNVDLRFMFGAGDWCNCGTASGKIEGAESLECYFDGCHNGTECCDTYPDSTTSSVLDVKDQAMVQGSNRLQRGLNYVSFLRTTGYMSNVMSAIFQGAHNDTAFFEDPVFAEWMYFLAEEESYDAVWR